jgi:hypothetical protein
MCGHHMVSEASTPRFVFRSRGSPTCSSECVKIQFHIQHEEPETAMLTVDSRVFDVYAPKVMRTIKNECEDIVVNMTNCHHERFFTVSPPAPSTSVR